MLRQVETRVGTFNPYQRSNNVKAHEAVAEWVQRIDLGGLQEYGGAGRRASLSTLAHLGVGVYKPPAFPAAPPLVYRLTRFELLRGRTPLVAAGRRVLPVPGKRSHLDDLFGTVAVLWDFQLE